MNEYQGTFGQTTCELHVTANPSVTGGPAYVAALFVYDDDKRELQKIRNDKGNEIELVAGSEQDVLSQASSFLEKKFGAMQVALVEAPERDSPVTIV
jgi:hypothetical protein